MQKHITFFLFFIFYAANSENYSRTIKNVLERRISPLINHYLKHLLEIIPVYVPAQQTVKGDGNLTPAVIVKALENIRDVLPQRVPIIPFAMADPTIDNILVYLAMYNSTLVNLTQFNVNASVSNQGSSTAINISLGVDTSGLDGHYELDVSNYGMHLYGNGTYSITSNDTDISVSISIKKHEDGSFLMTAFLVDLSENSTNIKLDNLLDGDPTVEPLIAFMAQMVPSEMRDISAYIRDTVNTTVVTFTNSYITKVVSWDDVVYLIKFAAGIYT